MYVKQAGELYRLLGDEVRLRLLRVLAGKHGRLNVTELTAVLGIAQSGVSRHLRLLKEAGLVIEERGGGFSFYRLSPALLDGGFAGLWPALQAQFAEAAHTPAVRGDESRLQEVMRLRPGRGAALVHQVAEPEEQHRAERVFDPRGHGRRMARSTIQRSL